MKHKIRKYWMFITMLCASLHVSAYDFAVDGIYYNILNGEVEVTSRDNNTYYFGFIDIPSSVHYYGETYSVVAIGDYAFSNCTGLTSVSIPNSVTKIGDGAFVGCTGLTSVTIPNSVTKIGHGAFVGCTGLTSVTIPKSVSTIGRGAFTECSGLISIDVDESNVYYCSIDGVLYNKDVSVLFTCPGKKETLTIPNTVTRIDDVAFFHSSILTSVTIPNSVTTIGVQAFEGCTGLTSVTIPNSVTRIWDSAFADCTGLTSVTIPNSVTTIGTQAFEGCTGLTSVTIPNSVTTIGSSAFSKCSSLISIDVDESNVYYCSIDGVLYNKDVTSLIACPGKKESVSIPNSVTTIEYGAFESCTSLTSVTIPNSVNTIGDRAFRGCTGLTSVTIPNSVITIGMSAFSGCSGLTSVTIPNSVITIGMSAFSDCSGLTSVTIPNSVKTIRNSAFLRCIGLTSIISYAVTPPTCGSHVFYDINKSNCTLYVPANCIDKYKVADQWKDFASIKEINSVPVNEIRLNKSEITVSVGESFQLSAEILPSNATDKSIIWESSNTEIATVDQNGKVTAVAQGTAVITAKSTDGSDVSDSCNVTVHKLVSGIVLSETELTLNEGQTAQLTATVSPELADNKTLAWTSSDESVATVDQTGKVTAIAQGTAVITAKSTDGSNIQAECNINVNMLTFVSDIDMESIRVYSSNTSIYLENVPANTLVRILQHNGTEIYRTQSIGETISHDPGFRGVYIVIIGTHSYKIFNY